MQSAEVSHGVSDRLDIICCNDQHGLTTSDLLLEVRKRGVGGGECNAAWQQLWTAAALCYATPPELSPEACWASSPHMHPFTDIAAVCKWVMLSLCGGVTFECDCGWFLKWCYLPQCAHLSSLCLYLKTWHNSTNQNMPKWLYIFIIFIFDPIFLGLTRRWGRKTSGSKEESTQLLHWIATFKKKLDDKLKQQQFVTLGSVQAFTTDCTAVLSVTL